VRWETPWACVSDVGAGRPARGQARLFALAGLLCWQAVALWLSVAPGIAGRGHPVGLAGLAAGVLGWAVSLRLLRGLAIHRRRTATWVLLGGQVLLSGVALAAPPAGSDDVYRYVWDGRVQAAGIDPYRYAPLDLRLSTVRTPGLFPGGPGCTVDHPAGDYPSPDCTVINRPEVRTVYPPVAEAAFWLVSRVRLARDGVLAFQLAGALVVLTVGLLVLRRAGPARAAVWGWFPPVLTGVINDAHVDGLAVLATVAGLLLAASVPGARGQDTRVPGARGHPGWAGALLGAAVAIKITPAVVFPALVRSRWVRVGLAAVAVVALSYLPHVLAVGPKVLGYLPGYLREEGYENGVGDRFVLLFWTVGPAHARTVGLLLLALLAAVAAWRADPRDPTRAALLVAGGSLLVVTPAYPWYGLLAVALAAAVGRPRWCAVALGPALSYSAVTLGFVQGRAALWGWSAAALVVILPGLVRVSLGRWLPLACSPAAAGSDRPGPPPRGPMLPPGRHPTRPDTRTP